jgi:hypothetical protein
MLSLANTYDKQDVFDFDRRVREALPPEKRLNMWLNTKLMVLP